MKRKFFVWMALIAAFFAGFAPSQKPRRQIINSILDNDLYALTMAWAARLKYPEYVTEDILIVRKKFKVTDAYVAELKRQVGLTKNLYLSEIMDVKLQKALGFFMPKAFFEWFRTYRFDPSEVEIWAEGNELKIRIKGLFYRTIMWETPLMALISELHFEMNGYVPDKNYIKRAEAKGLRLRQIGAIYSEFGTRRRFSYEVQYNVLKALIRTSGLLKEGGVLVGTSNVHMALELGITPTGTNAHKWYQLHAGIFGVRMANTMAIKVWEEVYGTFLGTVLTDTYTTKEFLTTYERRDAMMYESARQDSGNPIDFVNMFLEFLDRVRIIPLTKTILFSDSLDIDKVEMLVKYCAGKIKCAFGIGTFFSNDIEGVEPLKIVIKQVAVWLLNGRRVATCKLSDDPGKESGEKEAIWHAKYEIGIPYD